MKLFYFNKFVNSRTGSRIHSRAFIKHAIETMSDEFCYYPKDEDEKNIVKTKSRKIPYCIKFILIVALNFVKMFKEYKLLKRYYFESYNILIRYDLLNFSVSKFTNRYKTFIEVNSSMYLEHYKQRGFIYNIIKKYELYIWKNAWQIITVSSRMKDIMVENGIKESKIHVVPNGAEIIPITNIDLPNDTEFKTVAFSGSIKPWHNLDSILEVFENLWKNNFKIKLLVIGGDKYLDKKFNTYPFVIYKSNMPHEKVIKNLLKADILIAPYSYELRDEFYFSPLKIFEYLSLNKPIITSKIGQMEEYFNEDELFFCNPTDKERMTSLIIKIINNYDEAMNSSHKAYKKFISSFTWQKNFEKIHDIIIKN